MSWHPDRKKATRESILLAAAELFTEAGFNAIGIEQVMERAGMTRGAFYAHFKSKSDLYAEAVLMAGRRLVERSAQRGTDFIGFVRTYLTPGPSGALTACPLACLVNDIAQREQRLKIVYEQLFAGFVTHLQYLNRNLDDQQAQACASSLIGAQAVSRAMNSAVMAERLLLSAQHSIIEIYAVKNGKGTSNEAKS
jgi:TetR/AcrR family transcriptional repressor of nem operon